MPQLVTPRLILRPFAAADWDAVHTLLADPLTTRFMHFAELTEDEGREWFDGCVANAQQPDVNPRFWAIARRDSSAVIGWLGIGTSDEPDAAAGERSFGYLLDHRWWNQGYMTEALRAVLADEFGPRGTPVVSATCDVTNPASARVMEKAGLRRERTAFETDAAGNRTQHHHYAITKTEYDALN